MNRRNNQIPQEKAEEREAWFKMVIKVISWRDGPRENNSKVLAEKITPKEWTAYCKEIIKISTTPPREVTLRRLEEIQAQIKKHNGFA